MEALDDHLLLLQLGSESAYLLLLLVDAGLEFIDKLLYRPFLFAIGLQLLVEVGNLLLVVDVALRDFGSKGKGSGFAIQNQIELLSHSEIISFRFVAVFLPLILLFPLSGTSIL